MAEATIAVTAGAGTLLHSYTRTVGASTVHNEAVVQGEPHLASYVVQPGAVATAVTANSHMMQLMAGATLHVYIRRITIYQLALAGAATIVNVQIRRLTTAGTGGTSGILNPLEVGDFAAGSTAMTLPTVKGTEGASWVDGTMGVLAAAPTVPIPQGVVIFDWDADRLRTKSIHIPPGTSNGLCVKNVTALATASYLINMLITEATF